MRRVVCRPRFRRTNQSGQVMIWILVLFFLVALFVAALFWKPSKGKPSMANSPFAVAMPTFGTADSRSDRDKILDEDLAIISQVLRDDESDRRKQAALDRLKAYSPPAKAK